MYVGDYMRKDKGFTLIEVILAIALLGLISVAFLPSIASSIKWMVFTKTNITKETFKSQGEMEANINKIKEALINNESLLDGGNYKYNIVKKVDKVELFKTQFSNTARNYPSAYQIEVSVDSKRKFITLVGDERLPELPVPQIEVNALKLLRDATESPERFEYYNYNNLKLKGIANMTKNPQNSFNRYRHDWYVSKPGFIMPVPSADSINMDYDFGRIYPGFPDNYVSSPIYSDLGSEYSYIDENNRTINVLLSNNIVKSHPGRQILFTITPFSKALKKGNEALSMPIYIYGPDYNTDLMVHLDASTIFTSDKYNSSTNPKGSIENDEYRIRNWKNNRLSTNVPNENLNAKQTTLVKMPVLRTSLINSVYITPEVPFQGDESSGKVWGRALGNFNSNMSNMTINDLNLTNQWSLFAIMKMVDNPVAPNTSNSIMESTGTGSGIKNWSLSWDNNTNPKLKFTSGNSISLTESLNTNEWYMIRVTVNGTNSTIKAINLKNGVDHIISNNGVITAPNSKDININWNGIELTELLIYNTNVSAENIDKVETYLVNKYNPQ